MKRIDPALRDMLQKQAPGHASVPASKKKYPRDEHGDCIGQGAKDRPKDINLVHGWLGVNNDEAVPPPSPKGDWDWWRWRVTPYMWRYDNHDDHCDPRNQPIPLLANIVNLGVLLFLLVRFGKKPLAEALKRRKSDIMAEIEKARAIRTSARERLDQYEDELDHLDDKLQALQQQYALEGNLDEKRVVADMGATRDRMMADAEFRITQEGKAARDELSREALDAALAAAVELVRGNVTDEDHRRLAEEYLGYIGPTLRLAESRGTPGHGGKE